MANYSKYYYYYWNFSVYIERKNVQECSKGVSTEGTSATYVGYVAIAPRIHNKRREGEYSTLSVACINAL